MAAITLEATIENGRIILDEPEKLPQSGRARVTVLASEHCSVDRDAIERLLDRMKAPSDGLEYERRLRDEWSDRDHPESNRLP